MVVLLCVNLLLLFFPFSLVILGPAFYYMPGKLVHIFFFSSFLWFLFRCSPKTAAPFFLFFSCERGLVLKECAQFSTCNLHGIYRFYQGKNSFSIYEVFYQM